jgi:hypothetical protein
VLIHVDTRKANCWSTTTWRTYPFRGLDTPTTTQMTAASFLAASGAKIHNVQQPKWNSSVLVEDRIGRCASCAIRRRAVNSSPSSTTCVNMETPNRARSTDRSYPALAWTARRVASRVLMSDSFGSFSIIGSMAHPSPKGTSRVSEMARHSTITPPLRSSNRQ